MEMFSKLSKVDIVDLVKWVRDHNWNVVIGFKSVQYNVFEIDLSDPWKYKFVPDVGRIPVRKVSNNKRLLSVVSGYSTEVEDVSSALETEARKRSRWGSYPSPSQASTTRVGSLKKSIDHEITEFEFEFCLDSDGFIKNKDYKIPNYQLKSRTEPKTTEGLDEYYTDYDDDFDEDTMDVEDIPEDADFEWCWDEEGRLRIDEIDKEDASSRLSNKDYQLSAASGVILEDSEKIKNNKKQSEPQLSNNSSGRLVIHKHRLNNDESEFAKNASNNILTGQLKHHENAVDTNKNASSSSHASDEFDKNVDESGASESVERTESGVSRSEAGTSSSRRAKKRVGQITPPPTTSEKKEDEKTAETNATYRSSIIPPKASKSEGVQKTSKIASMFEMKKENNNSSSNLNILNRNKSSSNVQAVVNKPKSLDLKQKPGVPAPAPVRTQVVEVFEYDPLLGYCTVKRKTVPINEPAESVQSPVSANLNFLQTPPPQQPETQEHAFTHQDKPAADEAGVEDATDKDTSELSVKESEQQTSSGTSSKENKVPETSQQARSGESPMIPLSSMSKYDIPFLNSILGQKSIPEPPKSKPPKLPDSKLPMPKISTGAGASKKEPEKKEVVAPKSEIKVEVQADTKINVTVTKPVEKSAAEKPKEKAAETEKKDKNVNEAREWYWDYDEGCWKECDPDEEYEWEYIDDDDNDNEKQEEEIQATVKLSTQQNATVELSKDGKSSAESVTKKDRKADSTKDEGKENDNILFLVSTQFFRIRHQG